MTAYTKETVRKSMDAKRRMFLKDATAPKQIRFGEDKLALDFIVGYYYDQYKAWRGNYPKLSEVSYDDYYDMFVRKGDYEDMMDVLKEDYSNSKSESVKKLMATAKVLRNRYKVR